MVPTRKNNRLAMLIRKADFQQSDACIEDVEYHANRKLLDPSPGDERLHS